MAIKQLNHFSAYNFTLQSDFNLNLPHSTQKAEFQLIDSSINLPQMSKTRIHRKGVMATFGGDEADSYLHWEGIASYRAVGGHTLYYKRFTAEDGVFRVFTLSEAIALLLMQRGIFLLHASAVAIQQQATIFVGVPGAGKSTTTAAFAKEGFPILSDDITAIQFDQQGIPYVLPAFPEVKIWESAVDNLHFDKTGLLPAFEGQRKYVYKQPLNLFPTTPIPLREIVILRNKYSRNDAVITSAEIPFALLEHFPLPTQLLKGNFLQKHFMDSIRIAQTTAVYTIKRPKNFRALQDFVHSRK